MGAARPRAPAAPLSPRRAVFVLPKEEGGDTTIPAVYAHTKSADAASSAGTYEQ